MSCNLAEYSQEYSRILSYGGFGRGTVDGGWRVASEGNVKAVVASCLIVSSYEYR